MSHGITIGKLEGDGALKLDLMRLVDSRALIQANSGGGKSYLLRGIAEQAAGKVQTIIMDPEGEFATLREKIDLLLIGQEGEIQPSVRAAKLLARKVAELNVSAVIDLYDLKLHERREFVRDFCESLLSLPREKWHPMLIAIDECHMFAPERSAGDSVATEAVIGLASQGRKRGMALVCLTQRLSKLHKDVAAELNNVFVGRTWLPNDQERCGNLLGISPKERGIMRDLEPGEFYAFGPALAANGVVKFRSADVITTHPKAGERHRVEPPKPSKVIREIAAELADLPQQAEEEIKNLAAAKAKIAALERELRAKPKPDADPAALEKAVGSARAAAEKQWAAAVSRLRGGLEQAMKVIANVNMQGFEAAGVDPDQVKKAVEAATAQIVKLAEQSVQRKHAEFEKLKGEIRQLLPKLQKLLEQDVAVNVSVKHNEPFTVTPSPAPRTRRVRANGDGIEPSPPAEGITARQQKFLDAAATLTMLGTEVTRETVAAWVGVHPRGGSVGEELTALVDAGYILNDRGRITVTEPGTAAATTTDPAEAIERAKSGLSDRQRRFFDVIVEAYPNGTTREAIAERFEIHPRGGSLGEDLGRLVGRGLVENQGRGQYRARDFLFAGAA